MRTLAFFEALEPRQLLTGTISEQIIVDQFGWRANAPSKVVLFADPINGQNAAISYTPGATFQIRRSSDDVPVFTGSTAVWNGGATDSVSGDKVWSGDFSTLTTPGDYYVYDSANNLRSYSFKLDDNLDNDILKTATRMYYYQRTGTAIPAQFGGNWTHAIDHVGPNQDKAATQWLNGGPLANSTPRDLSGGWFDAGDYNKYVVFTTGVMWELFQGYEWNPGAFGDANNIPESGNGVPDILDEAKWELDWLLKMQIANGSVLNRVSNATYNAGNSDPSTDTQARYYTQATTWATASFAATLAHASRLFSAFDLKYPGYSQTLLAAAQNAWNYLQIQTTMSPSNGTDGGSGLASASAGADSGYDKRLRVLAAAELFRTTGSAAYKNYFETNYKDPSTFDAGRHPLFGASGAPPLFDPAVAPDINRALITYAQTPGADATKVTEIKNSLKNVDLSWYIVGSADSQTDPYRAFVWDYYWGSNMVKSQWAGLLVAAMKLNVNPANNAKYRQIAEEYVHYLHGRNPLSEVYLTNMGTHGANLGGDKSPMQPYHSWFGDGSALYDGSASTFGPVPGYLVGGPNKYFGVNWITPPFGEPPMKAFKDWNSAWNDAHQANENSWEITEPAIYYQASYLLLLSQFATDVTPPVVLGGAYQFQSAQAIKLTFGEPMNGATVEAGDLSIRQVDANGNEFGPVLHPNGVTPGTGNSYLFNFSTPLANGNYRVTLTPLSMNDAAGLAFNGTYTLDYYVLAGDANRDRTVDISDFQIWRNNFNAGTGGGDFSAGDFNYSGNVDVSDFQVWRNNFNVTIAAPQVQQPASRSSSTAVTKPAKSKTRPASKKVNLPAGAGFSRVAIVQASNTAIAADLLKTELTPAVSDVVLGGKIS